MRALALAAAEAGCGRQQARCCWLALVPQATPIPEAWLGCGWPSEQAQVSGWQVGEPRHVASEVSMGSWERTCQPQERTSCLHFPLPAAGAHGPDLAALGGHL